MFAYLKRNDWQSETSHRSAFTYNNVLLHWSALNTSCIFSNVLLNIIFRICVRRQVLTSHFRMDSLDCLHSHWSLFSATTRPALLSQAAHFLCSPAMQLMFSQQGVTVFWLQLPISVLLHPLTIMQKIKMSVIWKKRSQSQGGEKESALFPRANYEAMHAQPSFSNDKNNMQIENHSAHLEKHGETKGS